MKELINKLNHPDQGGWQTIALIYTIKIIAAIIVLFIGFWIINRIVKIVESFFEKRRIDNTINSFSKTFIGTVLKIFLIILVLNFIGVQTTSIVALIGAAGLAIGLALQGTLTNFAGGIMILIFKPFKVNDIIEAQGKKGKVRDIQIFNTILLTEDDKTIIIPNSILSNGIIQNEGKNPKPSATPISPEQKK